MSTAAPLARTGRRRPSWPWAYDGALTKGRDLRWDLLRGFCLFAMTIDHAQYTGPDENVASGPESWLYRASPAHAIQVVSAAEVFVFLSGFVMGMLYVRMIAAEGLRAATRRVLGRVVKLYGVIVGLSIFYVLLGYTALFPVYRTDDPLGAIVQALAGRQDPSGLFLMYLIFVAAGPLVFFGMLEGRTWLVLALSYAVWAGNLAYPDAFELPFASYFQIPAWQVLFVTGLVVGWHKDRVAAFLSRHVGWAVAYGAVVALLAAGLLAIHDVAATTGDFRAAFAGAIGDALQDLRDGGQLATIDQNLRLDPPRLFAAFVFLNVFFLVVHAFYRPLRRAVGWLFIPLGQASLYVYTMHLFLVYLLLPLFPAFYEIPEPAYGFALFGIVLVLWAMVRTRFLFFLIPR